MNKVRRWWRLKVRVRRMNGWNPFFSPSLMWHEAARESVRAMGDAIREGVVVNEGVREDVVKNGCKGLCCAAFYIGMSMEHLRSGSVIDGEQIADMVIPLTRKEAQERLQRFGSPMDVPFPASEETHKGGYYTCKNWDEETMLCQIYEDRPLMCSDYPYERGCEHGCSHEGRDPYA